MKYIHLVAIFSLFVLLISPAFAQNVSGPHIVKGVSEFEHTSYLANEDGDTTIDSEFEYKYGLTDNIGVAVEAEFKKKQDDSMEFEATEFKLNYQLTGKESLVSSTVRAAYKMDHLGDEDNVEAKLMLEKAYGKFKHRANIDLGHEVGEKSRSGLSSELALGSYYKLDGYTVGAEYFGDFGKFKDNLDYDEQEHQLGPYLEFAFPVAQQKVKMNVAYFGGISSAAADSTYKYEMAVKF